MDNLKGLTPEDIDRLESFDAGDGRVLSVYLDLDTPRRINHSYLIAFEDLVQSRREEVDEPAGDDLECEVAPVQPWLEGQDPRGKGLAVISCSPKRGFRVGNHPRCG